MQLDHIDGMLWDDDLDLMMPRGDYEKLIKVYEEGRVDEKYN